MAKITVIHVEIDDAVPLGPQIVAARAQGVSWKALERALGRSRQWLDQVRASALPALAGPALPLDGFVNDTRPPTRAH